MVCMVDFITIPFFSHARSTIRSGSNLPHRIPRF
jgi:hypothetical protein